MLYQQGDVLVRAERVPKAAVVTGHKRLAEGETTGHAHVAVADDVQLFEHKDNLYMKAPNGTAITHEEHKTIEIPSGEYHIEHVVEYDHFAEEARQVQD